MRGEGGGERERGGDGGKEMEGQGVMASWPAREIVCMFINRLTLLMILYMDMEE